MSSLPAAALSPPPKRHSQGASPHCLPFLPGTQPNHSLSPSFLPREHRLAAWPSYLGLDQTLAYLLFKGASLSCLPSHLGLGQTASYLFPSFQGSIVSLLGPPTWDSTKSQLISFLPSKGASSRCLALPPGTWPNHSLSPSFLPWEHRLAA
ncbi:hypothetical protein Adt_05500 [Abeliophyllum distichum]|uniref:Uncharacterized protein n=1 Tax=Abeliophyllum distichum TaxID=126358 RepID=A0ABD1V492_9LAMI